MHKHTAVIKRGLANPVQKERTIFNSLHTEQKENKMPWLDITNMQPDSFKDKKKLGKFAVDIFLRWIKPAVR